MKFSKFSGLKTCVLSICSIRRSSHFVTKTCSSVPPSPPPSPPTQSTLVTDRIPQPLRITKVSKLRICVALRFLIVAEFTINLTFSSTPKFWKKILLYKFKNLWKVDCYHFVTQQKFLWHLIKPDLIGKLIAVIWYFTEKLFQGDC